MPLSLPVEFLAVDEIQLCARSGTRHVFTERLLHARGKFETMFLGASTMAPLIRRLLPEAEIQTRERFSTLRYTGSNEADPPAPPHRHRRLLGRAGLRHRRADPPPEGRGGGGDGQPEPAHTQRPGGAVPVPARSISWWPPDAIGMGLNMDVDHVAFSGLRKFDGKRMRWLYPHEIGQIAGRAGRYKRDGTFGVTGDCEDMDDDIVEAVEHHNFEPVAAAEWRNARLDLLVPDQPDALAGDIAAARRSEAVGREPGRNRAAPAGPERRRARARAQQGPSAEAVGSVPDAGLPQAVARRAPAPVAHGCSST